MREFLRFWRENLEGRRVLFFSYLFLVRERESESKVYKNEMKKQKRGRMERRKNGRLPFGVGVGDE